MVPRPESVGVTKTGWGSLTLLAYNETMHKVLDQARHEDREVGRAVFARKQPDGELPPSLKCTPPHASAGFGQDAKRRRLDSLEAEDGEETEEEEDVHFKYQTGGTEVMIDPF